MKVTVASTLGLALVASVFVAVAAEPKVSEPSKPKPPKITHRNLYQMGELVKQGADPNAHYFLFAGLP